MKEWRRRTAGKVESLVYEFEEFSACNKVDFIRALGRMFGIECARGSFNGGLVASVGADAAGGRAAG